MKKILLLLLLQCNLICMQKILSQNNPIDSRIIKVVKELINSQSNDPYILKKEIEIGISNYKQKRNSSLSNVKNNHNLNYCNGGYDLTNFRKAQRLLSLLERNNIINLNLPNQNLNNKIITNRSNSGECYLAFVFDVPATNSIGISNISTYTDQYISDINTLKSNLDLGGSGQFLKGEVFINTDWTAVNNNQIQAGDALYDLFIFLSENSINNVNVGLGITGYDLIDGTINIVGIADQGSNTISNLRDDGFISTPMSIVEYNATSPSVRKHETVGHTNGMTHCTSSGYIDSPAASGNSFSSTSFNQQRVNWQRNHDMWSSTLSPSEFLPNPLPLELLTFQPTIISRAAIQLQWQTANEVGTDPMLLYRSRDGVEWEMIFATNSKGSRAGSYYTYLDENLSDGIYYYKLETNGKSWIRTVKLGSVVAPVTLYPNPTDGILHLSEPQSNLSLYNPIGQLIANYETTNEINLSQLPKGIYYLELENGERKIVVKK